MNSFNLHSFILRLSQTGSQILFSRYVTYFTILPACNSCWLGYRLWMCSPFVMTRPVRCSSESFVNRACRLCLCLGLAVTKTEICKYSQNLFIVISISTCILYFFSENMVLLCSSNSWCYFYNNMVQKKKKFVNKRKTFRWWSYH